MSRKSLFALRALNSSLALSDDGSILAELMAKPVFLKEIYEAQKNDSELQAKRAQCELGIESDFQIGFDGCLMFRDKVCVPKNDELIRKILQEAHCSSLSIHPGKGQTSVPSSLLQHVLVPKWKWDRVTMDFAAGLPLTPKKKDAIWVVIDKLTKSAYFILIEIRDLLHDFGGNLGRFGYKV
ncbi:uncharacterized protein LOC128033882 [Gossypium raimondii]|uniref:uncharacterized protein LOC128033882 n=1 Tax=Gossypium raimondii TaxID=29730 RepID=UPI00227A5D1C|nr:uncharacterized protein LOC128033882 [Gossypium raimondii]